MSASGTAAANEGIAQASARVIMMATKDLENIMMGDSGRPALDVDTRNGLRKACDEILGRSWALLAVVESDALDGS